MVAISRHVSTTGGCLAERHPAGESESTASTGLLSGLSAAQPHAEMTVVNDGSTDDTAAVCAANGVKLLHKELPASPSQMMSLPEQITASIYKKRRLTG